MFKIGLLFFLISLLSACSGNQEEKKQIQEIKTQKIITQELNVVEVKGKGIKENLSYSAEQETRADRDVKLHRPIYKKLSNEKKHSIVINKEKFVLQSKVLAKGSKVFNVLMSQYGTVKGTFVVITRSSDGLINFKSTKLIKKIADKTYRLTPDSDVDLSEYYRLLLSTNTFNLIEMEIDYSGPSHPLPQEK